MRDVALAMANEGKRLAALGKRLARIEYHRRALRLRRTVMLAVVAAWGALVALALTVVATWYLVAGVAALLASWLGERWGPLVTGAGLLLLMLLGALAFLRVSRRSAERAALRSIGPVPPRTPKDLEEPPEESSHDGRERGPATRP